MSLYSSSKDVTLTTTETTLHIDEKQQPDRFLTPQPVRQNSAKSDLKSYEPTPSPTSVTVQHTGQASPRDPCWLGCLLACFLCCLVKDEPRS